jgi:hypothetical protein
MVLMITAAQWHLRQENEYRAMCAFPINPLFSWKIAPGQRVPRCKEYLITYNVKTMVLDGGKLKPQKKTEVLIKLSDDPGGKPTAKIVGGRIPFHPNIYPDGNFCLGDLWETDSRLFMLVIKLGKVLAFDPAHTNPRSPANPDAAIDWNAKQSGLRKPYPCGSINFPHPVGY